MAATVSMPQAYVTEMNNINKNISSYSGYQAIGSALSKLLPVSLVAGLIGCIIPESGTNWRILNKNEYNGKGASGTSGWNCGEGLVQWTYWKYKLPLIQKFNSDSRTSGVKLPTTWAAYSQGTPVSNGGLLLAQQDNKHIAGLSLADQMVFLCIYYDSLLSKLESETNLAVIVAKIYQQKAGIGFYQNISDPVTRAYTTAKNKYKSSSGNHYLQSVKIAQQYLNSPVSSNYVASEDGGGNGSGGTVASTYVVDAGPNKVYQLASSKTHTNVTSQTGDRKDQFAALKEKMMNNTPNMGRDLLLSAEMYDSNILKGDQESKTEKFDKKDTKTEKS